MDSKGTVPREAPDPQSEAPAGGSEPRLRDTQKLASLGFSPARVLLNADMPERLSTAQRLGVCVCVCVCVRL